MIEKINGCGWNELLKALLMDLYRGVADCYIFGLMGIVGADKVTKQNV